MDEPSPPGTIHWVLQSLLHPEVNAWEASAASVHQDEGHASSKGEHWGVCWAAKTRGRCSTG